jgi:hypothetical protein
MPESVRFAIPEREGDKKRVAFRVNTGVKRKNLHITPESEALIVKEMKEGSSYDDITKQFKTDKRQLYRLKKRYNL